MMKKIFSSNSKLLVSVVTALAIFGLLTVSTSAKAQAPGIVGVDHFGINVPDMNQAIRFFHDLFGFEAVTKLGPFPMDAQWKKNFHIRENAGNVTIVMLRAGNGSNIELFQYDPQAQDNGQLYRDDLAATHLSLYTTDITATKSYLETKGLKFLTDINHGGGDTEGESWVYFETPWGSTIELNSYPKGKGYEKNKPAVKLWSAAEVVRLNTDSYTKADLQAIVSKQIQILNSTDSRKRLALMKELYQENVSFFDDDGSYQGIEAINEKFDQLQAKFKGFQFKLIKLDNSYNMVRFFWHYGPKSNPTLIAGMDLVVLENHKIRSFNVFFDHLPGKPN